MKIKNKGKVHPSDSSSSSSSPSPPSNKDRDRDVLSILKLLPTAILALVSVLSLDDKEVLAYMITRSMKTTLTSPSSLPQDSRKKSSKKPSNTSHKISPSFDCDCFDCYTSYWLRWDSSPNHELIQQAIEAFEDHLSKGEQSRKTTRGKRRDKAGRRVAEKPVLDVVGRPESSFLEALPSKIDDSSLVVDVAVSPDDDSSPASALEKAPDGENEVVVREVEEIVADLAVETEENPVTVRSPSAVNSRKGLARKVLPDVLGLLNSRLWNLWGPNV